MFSYLIIEDDPTWQRKIISDIDRNRGENFHIAHSLKKARMYIQKNTYDAVFVDLRLANEQTPFESLGKIILLLKNGEENSHQIIPLIVVTAYPVSAQDLIKAINTYQGWIWGWQDKALYDADQLRSSISSLHKSIPLQENQLLDITPTSPREVFIQKAAEDYHQITLGMLKEPQAQLQRWLITTQIFIAVSLTLILGGAVSALFWNVQVGTLTSISSIITGAISTLLIRQLRQSKKDFEASRNKVLEQYKNALKQLYQSGDNDKFGST